MVVFQVWVELLAHQRQCRTQAITACRNLVLALSLDIVGGYTGYINLGHAAFLDGAYAFGIASVPACQCCWPGCCSSADGAACGPDWLSFLSS